MIASFFNTKTTIEFADWIVAELKRAVPHESVSHKKKHVIRARGVDENIARRVVEFTRTTRLNVYTKARLAARVREGMSAHGYPKTFVDSFTLELISRIQAAAKSNTD
jgi:predicted DNA-binding helix-hairpin-helix protein